MSKRNSSTKLTGKAGYDAENNAIRFGLGG